MTTCGIIFLLHGLLQANSILDYYITQHQEYIQEEQHAALVPSGNISQRGDIDRFPIFGTKEFDRRCPWIHLGRPPTKSLRNCTILARPSPQTAEGISSWIPHVVSGHVMSLQTGCRFLLDYGVGIDLSRVLEPRSTWIDWRVPENYNCDRDPYCVLASDRYTDLGGKDKKAAVAKVSGKDEIASVHNVRTAFKSKIDESLKELSLPDLRKALPGLELSSFATCSLRSLFRLSKNAIEFQPNIFSTILPKLHSKHSMSISLYIRTGRTENLGGKEPTAEHREKALPIIECAIHLEEKYRPTTSTWMIVTDSQYLKRWITDTYTKSSDVRTVLHTQSTGAHTRATRGPSTVDFAEAFIDWYLIGESDVVIGSGPSFSDTATLRTKRPYYLEERGKCLKKEVFEKVEVGKDEHKLGFLFNLNITRKIPPSTGPR